MPDQQPAATENTPVTPNDADTAATVLTGGDGDHGPGGGGPEPRTAGATAGNAGAPLGTAPNAVVDVATPHDADDADGSPARADRQAGVKAAADAGREPQPSSS